MSYLNELLFIFLLTKLTESRYNIKVCLYIEITGNFFGGELNEKNVSTK